MTSPDRVGSAKHAVRERVDGGHRDISPGLRGSLRCLVRRKQLGAYRSPGRAWLENLSNARLNALSRNRRSGDLVTGAAGTIGAAVVGPCGARSATGTHGRRPGGARRCRRRVARTARHRLCVSGRLRVADDASGLIADVVMQLGGIEPGARSGDRRARGSGRAHHRRRTRGALRRERLLDVPRSPLAPPDDARAGRHGRVVALRLRRGHGWRAVPRRLRSLEARGRRFDEGGRARRGAVRDQRQRRLSGDGGLAAR